MMNPQPNGIVPQPSSPTNSSLSSSDLDTESTGSFFHDRSTTLGTLMGVTFPSITFRPPSSRHHHNPSPTVDSTQPSRRTRHSSAVVERRHRRRWWMLCRDRVRKPASLGEFLEVERRFGDVALYEFEGVNMVPRNGPARNSGDQRLLFADGRVLPPAEVVDDGGSSESGHVCPFSVSLGGICGGGVA